MVTELIEYGRKTEEETKVMQSKIKYIYIQGTNSDGKQIGTQINDLDRRKK